MYPKSLKSNGIEVPESFKTVGNSRADAVYLEKHNKFTEVTQDRHESEPGEPWMGGLGLCLRVPNSRMVEGRAPAFTGSQCFTDPSGRITESKVICSCVKVEGHFRFGKSLDKFKNVREQWVVAPPTGLPADVATATVTSKEKKESDAFHWKWYFITCLIKKPYLLVDIMILPSRRACLQHTEGKFAKKISNI